MASLCYVLTKTEAGFQLTVTNDKTSPPTLMVFSDNWNFESVQGLLSFLCKSLDFSCDPEVKTSIEEVYRMIEDMFFESLGCARTRIKETLETERIHSTVRNLESVYQSMLTSNDIDESIFCRSSAVDPDDCSRYRRSSSRRRTATRSPTTESAKTTKLTCMCRWR